MSETQNNYLGFRVYEAGGTIEEYTIVKFSSGKLVVATAASDQLEGAIQNAGGVESGDLCDLPQEGMRMKVEVGTGETIQPGGPITSDGSGKGKAASAGNHVIGTSAETEAKTAGQICAYIQAKGTF